MRGDEVGRGESGDGLSGKESTGGDRHHAHVETRLVWRGEGGGERRGEGIVGGRERESDGRLREVGGYGDGGRGVGGSGGDWQLVVL